MSSTGPAELAAVRGSMPWPRAAVTELVVPETARATWEIRGYSLLDKSNGKKKESPALVEVAGARFCLRIYIGGDEKTTPGSFAVFCFRVSDASPAAAPVSASFKIIVVDQGRDGITGIEKTESELKQFAPTGISWGWPSFGTVEDLERCLKDDTLVVGLEVSAWASGKEHEWKLPAAPGSQGDGVAVGARSRKRPRLVEDLAAVFTSGQAADVEVSGSLSEASEHVLKAHWVVLAARSPVFSRMLESGMREAQVGAKISLDGVDHTIAERFVRFLYTDELNQETLDSPDSLCHLLGLGHRFEVQSLVDLCSARLTVTDDTAIDRLIMAEQLSLTSMKEQVLSFVCSCRTRLAKIQKSDPFSRMSKNYPQLVVELLAHATQIQ